MMYTMQQPTQAARLIEDSAVPVGAGEGDYDVRQTGGRRTGGKTRRVRWIGSLWKGKSSTARKEAEKEEVLAVFRELAREFRSEGGVREYVPWKPGW
jgi:hypothetical protein